MGPAWLIPLLVTVLALALPAVGEAAPTGSIAGTVTAEGGGGLVGVQVCAEEEGGAEEFECAETGVGGTYEIVGLGAGQYSVSFTPGKGQNYVRQFYDGAPTGGYATPVTVASGRTSGIDAVVAKGAKISGTITAATSGLPVSEALVCAYSAFPYSSGCAESDAFGNYLILGLAAASFEVEAFPTDENQNLVGTNYPGLVAVPAAGEAAGINIALQPGGQIEGTVRLASTGAPVAGVDVCVTEADLTWSLGCLKTPASGGYRFYGLWTGSFKVAFSPEASEFAEGEQWEIVPDSFSTQWWNGKPYFETATPIGITFPGEVVGGIDGSLGPGPVVSPPATVPSTPPAATVVKPKPKPTPKPLKCKRGFAKKKVKGKVRCVKRHKPKHRRRHHPKPRKQVAHSR